MYDCRPLGAHLALRIFVSMVVMVAVQTPTNAQVVTVGKGSYRTDLPLGDDGQPRRLMKAKPSVGDRFAQPVPTNDWCSSLVWPTVLDGQSDWVVTALWKSQSDELLATFGHGLPFVYFERKSERPAKIQFLKASIDRHQQPVEPIVFELRGVDGKHSQADGKFLLSVNAGKNVGVGSMARIQYDFDGDGETDRVERFSLMATDPVESSWETYSDQSHELDSNQSHGAKRDFKNGTVTLEFWKVFGEGQLQLDLESCKIELPIDEGTRFPSKRGSLEFRPQSAIVETAKEGPTAAKIFYRDRNSVGVTVNRTHYGLFAPGGATWLPAGSDVDELSSSLGGKSYFSIAVLPDNRPETIKWFQDRAFAFVRDTNIEYRYDARSSSVKTVFSITKETMEGQQTELPIALYRHQHLNLVDREPLTEFEFAGPRGNMKVLSGESFTTSTKFLGVLPSLPVPESSKAILGPMVEAYFEELSARERTFERDDTYWNGKEFGKISEVIQIATQIGKDKICEQLVKLLQRRLESWFDAADTERFFYYDKTWNTLIGYPDSYGSADTLNDHHFHYSYFIKAAATIAQYDPDWVRAENYGGMIDLLIRNCATGERGDPLFPWMRFFDPYAGHSWASGNAAFASGNNQESSSESMNFATALILYGEAIGDERIRDLGVYWHATEAEAIKHYWFDNDGEVFPTGFGAPCVGMVWGDGGTYGTWWTANPEEIHGINFLPLTGGSLYLARDPDYVKRNFESMLAANERFHNAGFEGDPLKPTAWQDITYEYLALADPADAARRYQVNGLETNSEFGETKAHTHQWIAALTWLGRYDASVQANWPTAVAFNKQGKRAYVVYNGGQNSQPVKFTDGVKFDVPVGLHCFWREN
jgi:endoglucanase Acf2